VTRRSQTVCISLRQQLQLKVGRLFKDKNRSRNVFNKEK